MKLFEAAEGKRRCVRFLSGLQFDGRRLDYDLERIFNDYLYIFYVW